MKKIMSFALAIMMIATMSISTFATEINQDTENKTSDVTIEYTQSESYVVIIPDKMTVNTDATVEAKDIVIGYNKQLTVTVASTNNWNLMNNNDSLGYTLTIGGTAANLNNTVLTAASGETVSKTLSATVTDGQSPKYAGDYTDTLTFTVSVGDATSGS